MKRNVFLSLLLASVLLLAACGPAADPALSGTPDEAIPESRPVTVTFDANGGTVTGDTAVTVTAGETVPVTEPSAPSKGVYFGGYSDGARYYYAGDAYPASDPVTLTARWLPVESEITLLDCENNQGWWGSDAVSVTESGQNGSAVAVKPTADGCVIFCHAWDPKIDLTALDDDGTKLSVSLYIKEAAALRGGHGMFEISHTMGGTVTAWSADDWVWQDGWNTFTMELKDAAVKNAQLDAVDYIRFYFHTDNRAGLSMRMDDLRLIPAVPPCTLRYESGFVGDNPAPDAALAGAAVGTTLTLMQNPFEKAHCRFCGWRDNAGTVTRAGASYTVVGDTVLTAVWEEDPTYAITYQTEGAAAPAPARAYAGSIVMLASAPVRDGYVFDGWQSADGTVFYADSRYAVGAGDETLTARWRTPVSGEGLVAAWDLSEGGQSETVPADVGEDASQIWVARLPAKTFGFTADFSTEASRIVAKDTRYDLSGDFTVSAFIKAPVRTLGLDRTVMAFGSPADPDAEVSYTDFTVLDDVSSASGWAYGHVEKDAPDGGEWVRGEADGEDCIVFVKSFKRSAAFADYTEDGFLHIAVYAEHASHIVSGQLEFTSSGGCDKNELNFSVGSLNLKDGWNEVFLPLSAASHEGGDFDSMAFNFCRFYFFTDDAAAVGFDDISLCRAETAPEAPEARLFLDGITGELTLSLPGVEGLASSGVSLTDGKWHHVAVSRGGDTVTYYADGQNVRSLSVSGICPITDGTPVLGADCAFGRGFDGSMAEVRLYDRAVTPDAITDTVIDEDDNVQHATRLTLDHGLVFDRRQYGPTRPDPAEGQTVTENDIVNAINMGFDHVKILLTPNHIIGENGELLTEKMDYITEVLDYVTAHDFVCYLCVHPEDNFKPQYLGSADNFELLCRWYGELACWLGSRCDADHVGLQLMTEPGSQGNRYDWSWYSDRMWSAARNVLPYHTLITSADSYGNFEHVKSMSPATDDNLIYSFTTYEPISIGWHGNNTYTDPNGYWQYIKDMPYPVEKGKDYSGIIEDCIEYVPDAYKAQARADVTAFVEGRHDGMYTGLPNFYDVPYGRDWHFARAKSLDDWSKANGGNIHTMAVEWGCMDRENVLHQLRITGLPDDTGTSDALRLRNLKDMRESFNAYGIGWSYWSYNEAFSVFTSEGFIATHDYYTANCRETGDVPDENGHCYGLSPDPETAIGYYDWDLLTDSFGLTPLVERPAE